MPIISTLELLRQENHRPACRILTQHPTSPILKIVEVLNLKAPYKVVSWSNRAVSGTLLSVLIVTFSCGSTRSTSRLHSAASVVDSKISSCLADSFVS